MTALRDRWVAAVLKTTLVGDATKVLLVAMSLDMDHKGYVSVLRPVLAERIGRSERRVTERLSDAVEAKLLDHVRRGQKGVTPVYRAMLPHSLSETVYSPLNTQRDGSQPAEMSPDRPAESRFSGTPGGPTSSRAAGDTLPLRRQERAAFTSALLSDREEGSSEVDGCPTSPQEQRREDEGPVLVGNVIEGLFSKRGAA